MTFDIATLRGDGFTGDIVLSSDADYDEALVRCSRVPQTKPGAIAFVKSPQDVAYILKAATAHKFPVVIKGGGYSTGGAASTKGGLVVDLSRHLITVRVDAEKKLGYVGGGCSWKHLDEETIKYGLAAVGGTVNHNGVGGLVLGGGFGWLSGRHGLAVDSLEEATLVTAAGDILKLSSTSNPDLFWGIRGGGCNFGVVTEFVLRLHPQGPKVYASTLIFLAPRLQPAISALETWFSKDIDPDTESAAVVFTRCPEGDPLFVVKVFYNGDDEEEGRKRFKFLSDVGPVRELESIVPYESVNGRSNDQLLCGTSKYLLSSVSRTCLLPLTAQSIFDKFVSESGSDSRLHNLITIWEYYPMAKTASISPDASTPQARTMASGAAVLMKWDTLGEEMDQEAKQALTNYVKFAQAELGKAGNKPVDDAGYEGSSDSGKVAVTFGANLERLSELKRKYDPDHVFNNRDPIAPAAAI